MARPAYERVGVALRHALDIAGLRQEDVATALKVDQTTVSRWVRGLQKIDLEYFPMVDELCNQPLGYVLRLAGYVEDPNRWTIEQAVKATPGIKPGDRQVLLGLTQYVLDRADSIAAAK